MQHETIAVASVNGHQLDLVNGMLLKNDRDVPIRPKSFALLRYLVHNSGRVISREELFEAVWGNITVSDDALTQTVRDVRRAISDTDGSVLKTVAKRGYMLTAEQTALAYAARVAEVEDAEQSMSADPRDENAPARPLADNDSGGIFSETLQIKRGRPGNRASGRPRPGVVVLPFALSDDYADDLPNIRNGLLRDISGHLLKLQSLFVIDAGSAEMLADSPLDWREVGRLFHCDYVCTGTLATIGDSLHLAIMVNAVEGGRLLVSERMSRPKSAASQVGGELAGEIARTIESEIEITERNRSFALQPFELDAWQAFHRGMWHLLRYNPDDIKRSAPFFQLAVDRDPTFSRAYSALAFTHWVNAYLGADDAESESRTAYELAVLATTIGPKEPCGHCSVGRSLWIAGEIDEALETFARATAMSPNNVLSNFSWGYVEACAGDPELALQLLDHARTISPFDPHLSPIFAGRAIALTRLDKIQEAADWGLRAATHPSADPHVLRVTAMTLTAAGRHQEAVSAVQRVKSAQPEADAEQMIRVSGFRPDDAELFRDLARQCGLS